MATTTQTWLERLVTEEDGQHALVYALWVGAATAVVEPYTILAGLYRISDLLRMFAGQFQGLSW